MATVATFPAWFKWVGDPDYDADSGLPNFYRAFILIVALLIRTQLLVINSLCPLYPFAKCNQVNLDHSVLRQSLTKTW